MKDDVYQALLPVRRRLRLLRAVRWACWGLLAGGCACLAGMIASFFAPLPDRGYALLFLFFACALTPGVVALLLPLPEMAAARAADACALKERAETALSLRGRGDAMALLQRQDACLSLRALALKRLPLRLPRRALAGCLAALMVSAALLLIPNPQTGAVARIEALRRALEDAAQQAEAAEKALNDPLREKEKQELRKLLGDLSRDLRSASDSREAFVAMNEAQERLEKLRDSLENSPAAQALQNAGLESLAEALGQDADQALAEAAQTLMENAGENGTALQNAAASLSGADAQAMAAAASALSAGDLSALQSALSSLSAAQTAQALSQMQSLLSQMRSAMNGGQGQHASAGNGQGQGAGQGAGQGEGEGSSGAGRGSTHQDQGYSEDSGRQRGQGQDTPEYRENEFEAIYDPTRLDATDTALQESGARGEGDSLQAQLGPGLGSASGSVPYRQVAGEYREAAAQAMSGLSLPSREQGLVDDYFTAITE